MSQHHDHQHHHHGHDKHGPAALAELLDLDGEVLSDYLSEVTMWLRRQAADLPHGRVVDLGAGTGAGTIALAQRFDAAEVIAVDVSEQMLNRVRAKASEWGIADRVRTVQADLANGWPTIDPVTSADPADSADSVDVVWASNSLHEIADPDRVFADIAAALRPGGLLAVAEMDSAPCFLPDDIGLGRPGLEARWRRALEGAMAENDESGGGKARPQPLLGPDWGPHLERAGFTVVAERRFAIDLRPPHQSPVGRYAQTYLRRIRPLLEHSMAADDLLAIDALLDSDGPEGLLNRADLRVRNTRTVWLARVC